MVKTLVSEGKANVDLQEKSGYTALIGASSMGHAEVVRFLVTEGKANVDVKNEAPPLMATRRSSSS